MTRATLYALAWIAVLAAALAAPSIARGSDLPHADALVHTYAPGEPVTCDPTLPPTLFGLTYYDARGIRLAPIVCLGVFLYDATPAYRELVHELNPTINVEYAIAVGILVTLHEAQHAAGIHDETVAECLAMRYAQPLLANDPVAWNMARLYDARLPADYHDGATC